MPGQRVLLDPIAIAIQVIGPELRSSVVFDRQIHASSLSSSSESSSWRSPFVASLVRHSQHRSPTADRPQGERESREEETQNCESHRQTPCIGRWNLSVSRAVHALASRCQPLAIGKPGDRSRRTGPIAAEVHLAIQPFVSASSIHWEIRFMRATPWRHCVTVDLGVHSHYRAAGG